MKNDHALFLTAFGSSRNETMIRTTRTTSNEVKRKKKCYEGEKRKYIFTNYTCDFSQNKGHLL